MSGIRRIYGNDGGNVPSSARIVQDCKKAIRAFGIVMRMVGVWFQV